MPRKKETLSEFLTAKRAEVQSEDAGLRRVLGCSVTATEFHDRAGM